MAEGVLASNIVKEVLAKIGSSIWSELALLRSFRADMRAVERDLATVRDVLFDAEARGGGGGDSAVRDWLRRLRDVAHDIDDLLDECRTDLCATRRRGSEDTICGISTNLSVFRSLALAHRLRSLRRKLDAVAAGRDRLRLNPNAFAPAHPPAPPRPETISMVDESKTIGRAADKEKLMRLVLDSASEEDVSVIPIVGFGGLGKTTLAQLVFNDRRTNDEVFDPRIWVSMSVDSSIRTLVKPIESATKERCDLGNLDSVASFLSRTFTGMKYLLVLDDLCSENQEEWEKMKLVLKGGKRGSKIIVTTRSKKVAKIVRTVSPFMLKGLSDDDCWELFRCKAFEQGQEDLHLVRIGKEIVRKCGGMPLAAKALGSMLRFNKSEQSWMAIKDSEVWQMEKEETILPSLKLSYNQMAPGLKQCFAYCSVFPRNHEISKEVLIQQWVSLGFIQPEKYGHQSVFDRASDCFEHLVWMSFLQEVEEHDLSKKEVEEDGNVKYKIHDLVHDLAQSVAGEEVQTINCKQVNSNVEDCLYASLSDDMGMPKVIQRLFRKTLPDSIGKLQRLQTLNFKGDENSRIAELEDLNLLTGYLRIECWSNKNDLTTDGRRANMRNKKKLSSLSLSWTSPSSCYDHTGAETFLEVLVPPENIEVLEIDGYMGTKFPDQKDNQLELLTFPVLKTVTITECPKLMPRPCLPDAISDLSVSSSSKMLSARRSFGASHLASASLLRRLWIKNCHACSKEWYLLQHRPKLEDLVIDYCETLHVLPEAIQFLATLQSLKILNCTELETLPEWLGELLTLKSLEISCCPKLASLPKGMQCLTALEVLTITSCSSALNESCRKHTGKDWFKICHIPSIHIS
ncbi:hypothetical protein PR202_gb26856 [Eleusine coracana subsp. coracana]|uniref:Uncharacterized protein n=1 Tax=Eleusine coracana subsp. coracana TaxID=191504 RepID=A0AAV5FUD0_ELECO|nr:hypothetical protein PR202_gb26856 [Eleusine coracana subsp. coracana]